MNPEAFFTLHRDLPREGPGTADDVAWACQTAGIAPTARILDAGCGPGADIAALLDCAPQGSVLAVDKVPHFHDAAKARHAGDARVTVSLDDMASVDGTFDLIWSAGALYFLGIKYGLTAMAQKLAPGGSIAFSHLVYTVAEPDPDLRAVLDAEPDVMSDTELQSLIQAAGFSTLDHRLLPNASWDAYYVPMRARIDALRLTADAALQAVLDEGDAEIAMRERFADQWGYVLSVVRPA